MKQFNFDIKAAIHAQPNTLVSFGLEFRNPIDLEPLLSGHPHWQALKEQTQRLIDLLYCAKRFIVARYYRRYSAITPERRTTQCQVLKNQSIWPQNRKEGTILSRESIS
jgi:hypothetical protein